VSSRYLAEQLRPIKRRMGSAYSRAAAKA